MKGIILALSGLLLLAAPEAVQAQLYYSTSADGSVTATFDGLFALDMARAKCPDLPFILLSALHAAQSTTPQPACPLPVCLTDKE